MRGLYFLTFLALVGAIGATKSTFNKDVLPSYMRDMTVDELKKEVYSLMRNERGLDESIIAFIEWFQGHMDEGFPALGIPPLDPLFINRIDYNLTSDLLQVVGYIAQTTVQDLSAFNINYVTSNLLRLTIDFNFTWPAINMGGLYGINGVMTLLPIYGEGPYTLTLHNFSIWGSVGFATRLNGTAYIRSLDLDLNLGALTNNFEGLMGGGEMGAMVNDMITDMGPALINSVKNQILDPIEQLIMNVFNAYLAQFTVAEIIDIIQGIIGGGETTLAP